MRKEDLRQRQFLIKHLLNKDQENVQSSRCFCFHVKVWLSSEVPHQQLMLDLVNMLQLQ